MSTDTRRALVTGDTGFVGRHLVAALVADGWMVVGVARAEDGSCCGDGYVHQQGSLLDESFLAQLLSDARPTHVFHVAGQIETGDPRALYEQNFLATQLTLNALDALGTHPWTLVMSSSAVYGDTGDQPVDESAPVAPLTDYATSKAAQELVAMQFHRTGRLPVVVARPFNIVGPGQAANLVLSEVARQLAQAELDGTAELLLGRLDHRRDFLDVRDVCQAVLALARISCQQPVWNIASGRSTAVVDCVDQLRALATTHVNIAVDPNRVRHVDIAEQIGDASLLREETGWTPAIELEQSLVDLLGWWRLRVREGRPV